MTEKDDIEYEVESLNANTEKEVVGELGTPIPLLAGLAEKLIMCCDGPEMVEHRIYRTDDGAWRVDPDFIIKVYYPGNSSQTCFFSVSEIKGGEEFVDYYQVPYSEIVPRTKLHFKSREDAEYRYIISEINNIQLENWLKESGVIKMSEKVRALLSDEEDENIRNKHIGGLESRSERAND